KVIEIRDLVRIQLRIEGGCAEDEILLQLLGLLLELAVEDWSGTPDRAWSKGRFVRQISNQAGLLKFERQKEGRRGVDPSYLATSDITGARVDIVDPEGKSRGVRLAIEKVKILLSHKEVGCIDHIADGRARIVIVNRQRCGTGR